MTQKNIIFGLFKYIWLVVLMYACAICGVLFYMLGVGTYLLIMLLAFTVAYIGYVATSKIRSLMFLYVNLLISVYLGSSFSTSFFCKRISFDDMSLIIGNAFEKISMVVTAIAVSVFLVVRFIWIKAQKISS